MPVLVRPLPFSPERRADDLASEIVVFAGEDERHPTASELTLNGVGSAKCGKEAFRNCGHTGRRLCGLRSQQLLDSRRGDKVGNILVTASLTWLNSMIELRVYSTGCCWRR